MNYLFHNMNFKKILRNKHFDRLVYDRSQRVTLHEPFLYLCFSFIIFIAFEFIHFRSFVPIMNQWEHFHYAYTYGAVDPTLSFAVAPRANVGGQGYFLVEIGFWLSSMLGEYSLSGFRLIMHLYSGAIIFLMVRLFRRYFGIMPALLGTLVVVFSPGFIVFANQTLPLWPSLLLTLLFTERFDAFLTKPNNLMPQIVLGFIGALMLTHYAMSRYYLVGFILISFFFEIIKGVLTHKYWQLRIHICISNVKSFSSLSIIILFFFIALDLENAVYILNPKELFFPDNGDEIELAVSNLAPTILANLKLLFLSISPVISRIYGMEPIIESGTPEILLNAVYPLFFDTQLFFLMLGTVILFSGVIKRDINNFRSYFLVCVMALLTIVPPLFSEQIVDPPIATFSPFRLINAYVAFLGVTVVAIFWFWQHPVIKNRKLRYLVPIIVLGGVGLNIQNLNSQHNDWISNIAEYSTISSDGSSFEEPQKNIPYGVEKSTYLQARFLKTASLLKAYLKCEIERPFIIQIDPEIYFIDGQYPGPSYIRPYNDLSASLSLYLGQVGLAPIFVIAHEFGIKGKVYHGEGYAGIPRVFSGPIQWDRNKLSYGDGKNLKFHLKGAVSSKSAILISFSDEETYGLKSLMKVQKVRKFISLTDFHNTNNCVLDPHQILG